MKIIGGDLSKKLNLGGAKFKGGPMNPNDVIVVVLKTILLCWLGFRFIYIVHISWYYISDVSNVLLPATCLSFGLPVCQSNFNGWFRSQGKYRATLEFKSSGCAVNNSLIYDSSLSLSVSVRFTYCAPPLSVGWGVEPLTKFKKGGLTGPQLLEGGCWERGEVTFFRGGCAIVT